MTEKKPTINWVPIVLSAVIGLAFIGLQTSQKISSENVANLPAIIERIENFEVDVNRRFQEFQAQLDRRIERELQRQFDDIDERLDSLERQSFIPPTIT